MTDEKANFKPKCGHILDCLLTNPVKDVTDGKECLLFDTYKADAPI